jgi:hypothetical protein
LLYVCQEWRDAGALSLARTRKRNSAARARQTETARLAKEAKADREAPVERLEGTAPSSGAEATPRAPTTHRQFRRHNRRPLAPFALLALVPPLMAAFRPLQPLVMSSSSPLLSPLLASDCPRLPPLLASQRPLLPSIASCQRPLQLPRLEKAIATVASRHSNNIISVLAALYPSRAHSI